MGKCTLKLHSHEIEMSKPKGNKGSQKIRSNSLTTPLFFQRFAVYFAIASRRLELGMTTADFAQPVL
jgi:hypothetical protein